METKISFKQKLIYGSGEFFNATTTVIILMFFMKFLTDIEGIRPALAGIILVAGKLWDAFSDPLIGRISDNSKSKLGRRRFFLLVFSLPAGLFFVALWFSLSVDSITIKIIYYTFTYLTFKTFFTFLNVPYQALGMEMSNEYSERTSLVLFRMIFSIGGSIIAGVTPGLLLSYFSKIYSGYAHLLTAALFSVIYIFIWLNIFLRIKEKSSITIIQKGYRQSLKMVFNNRSFKIILGVYLFSFLALDLLTAGTKFFIDDYLQKPNLLPLIMGVMLSSSLFALFFYSYLSKVKSRRFSFLIGIVIWSIGLILLSFIPQGYDNKYILALIMAIIGFGVAAAFIIPWSALAEVVDTDILRGKTKEPGIYAGVMTFARKLASTLALLFLSQLLDWSGYVGKVGTTVVGQPTLVITSIRATMSYIPLFIILIAGAFMMFYPLTKTRAVLLEKICSNNPKVKESEKIELCKFL